MLRFLFPRLTSTPERGVELFDAVIAEARARHWYVEGEVPDTLDRRFALLATIAALVLVRLERDGEEGDMLSVAVTERFIAVMESEHREMGIGDPTLGRTVRKLVGALSRRVDLWRAAVASGDWSDAARESIPDEADDAAIIQRANRLQLLWRRLEATPLDSLARGRIG